MTNEVFILGRIGNDLEIKMAGETKVLNFTLAVPRIKKDETDWINCVAFGNTAEAMVKFTCKGKRVLVDGALRNDEYTDKEGNKRTQTKVVANRVDIIDFHTEKVADTQGNPFVEESNDNQLPF